MVDLSTKYMGFDLKNPIIPSSSPLSRDVDNVRKMEDLGAAAVVMDSLFEEEIKYEAEELTHFLELGTESFSESTSFFPKHETYLVGPEQYLDRIRKLKEAVDIPVIASLNGIDAGEWTRYAKMIEDAGADGLELNIYFLETSFNVSSTDVENRYVDILKAVKSNISIPVAVKLSPFFSAFASMAKRLSEEGNADALVLFNRFYQPDLDIENLVVVPDLFLSTSNEMRLPLRWIAILYGHLSASLAHTRGIHSHEDVIKAVMAGADVVQMTSVLLHNGIDSIKSLLDNVTKWMEEHDYDNLRDMKGSLSMKSSPNPSAFARANYMKILRSYSS
ncbi:dihydroorotate dehydrogenase-like protein [candidate division KSB1 bacterium]